MSKTIADRAKELGLSGATIARRTGMSKATWHRRMKRGDWRMTELPKVAHVLGMEPAELVGRGAAA